MHYRHHYHAGNFADVFKHVLLLGLLQNLSRKDKPWCYLDTHAGAGHYSLGSNPASTTQEWRDGVGRLLDAPSPPKLVADYLALIAGERSHLLYPGSPAIAAAVARPGDRRVCCERVAEVAEELHRNARGAEIHVRDGYEAHSLLPPKEKRGLVLVDPAFEARDEFDRMHRFLEDALERFANGVYALWFPLKNRHQAERFLRRATRDRSRPHLSATLDTDAPGEGQMRACGMLILNAPFGFDVQAREALNWLAPKLGQGARPSWSVETH
ncbi:MAG: 23S rRNA (adenine(2030)-N(6))-methyltransferase RlmJ [Panacagrimonas sp.]